VKQSVLVAAKNRGWAFHFSNYDFPLLPKRTVVTAKFSGEFLNGNIDSQSCTQFFQALPREYVIYLEERKKFFGNLFFLWRPVSRMLGNSGHLSE
jgi:hypothetical protein